MNYVCWLILERDQQSNKNTFFRMSQAVTQICQFWFSFIDVSRTRSISFNDIQLQDLFDHKGETYCMCLFVLIIEVINVAY